MGGWCGRCVLFVLVSGLTLDGGVVVVVCVLCIAKSGLFSGSHLHDVCRVRVVFPVPTCMTCAMSVWCFQSQPA